MRRTIITVVAAVALGMAAMTTGAMARGSGGHGGVVAAISAEAAPPTSVAEAAICWRRALWRRIRTWLRRLRWQWWLRRGTGPAGPRWSLCLRRLHALLFPLRLLRLRLVKNDPTWIAASFD